MTRELCEKETGLRGRPIVGISVGDPGGIGPEITAKALSLEEIYDLCAPIVVCDARVMEEGVRVANVELRVHPVSRVKEAFFRFGTIDVFDVPNIEAKDITYGSVNPKQGKASFEYVERLIELALRGEIHATVTGPIHKGAINAAGYHFPGHTEIFAHMTSTTDYAMMLAHGDFRVVHVSTHVSLREACDMVRKERVLRVIELTFDTLRRLGIERPRIAVAGLNPHSGEGGLFGKEELEEIIPAVAEAKRRGINAEGPLPPDTVFVKMKGGLYDVVVVMYHDQGHIPLKLVGFQYDEKTGSWSEVSGVNVTLGLPIIRTSVDHGTAFGKAGSGRANPASMKEAIKMAARLAGKA